MPSSTKMSFLRVKQQWEWKKNAMIWKRQETLEELFFNTWIANANFAITCIIPFFSFLLLKPTYKILNLKARKKNRNLKLLENTCWCKVIKFLWNYWSSSSRVKPRSKIRVGLKVRFKFRCLNRGQG
jgi:hypothetical protein